MHPLKACVRLKYLHGACDCTLLFIPSSAPASDLSGLHLGTKVRHDRFGEGEVIAIEGEGGNAKATVSFTHFGQKQLLLKFARLTIVKQ